MALLDAGQALQGTTENTTENTTGTMTDNDLRLVLRRLCGFSGAPFYVVLMLFGFVAMVGGEAPPTNTSSPAVESSES